MALPMSSLTAHWLTRVAMVGIKDNLECPSGIYLALTFIKSCEDYQEHQSDIYIVKSIYLGDVSLAE